MTRRLTALLLAGYAILFAGLSQVSAHRETSPSWEHSRSVHLYFVAIGGARGSRGAIGCGDRVVAVTRRIPPTTMPMRATLQLLFADHHRYYGRSGLYNALAPARLQLRYLGFTAGHATVRLSGRLNQGGVCDAPRIRAQLRRTVLQFGTVHSVSIFINGTPLRRLLSGKG